MVWCPHEIANVRVGRSGGLYILLTQDTDTDSGEMFDGTCDARWHTQSGATVLN